MTVDGRSDELYAQVGVSLVAPMLNAVGAAMERREWLRRMIAGGLPALDHDFAMPQLLLGMEIGQSSLAPIPWNERWDLLNDWLAAVPLAERERLVATSLSWDIGNHWQVEFTRMLRAHEVPYEAWLAPAAGQALVSRLRGWPDHELLAFFEAWLPAQVETLPRIAVEGPPRTFLPRPSVFAVLAEAEGVGPRVFADLWQRLAPAARQAVSDELEALADRLPTTGSPSALVHAMAQCVAAGVAVGPRALAAIRDGYPDSVMVGNREEQRGSWLAVLCLDGNETNEYVQEAVRRVTTMLPELRDAPALANGQTLLQVAVQEQACAVAALLLAVGANPCVTHGTAPTPLALLQERMGNGFFANYTPGALQRWQDLLAMMQAAVAQAEVDAVLAREAARLAP